MTALCLATRELPVGWSWFSRDRSAVVKTRLNDLDPSSFEVRLILNFDTGDLDDVSLSALDTTDFIHDSLQLADTS